MPVNAAARREWTGHPVGVPDVLAPIATELAGDAQDRGTLALCALMDCGKTLAKNLHRHTSAPRRAEARDQLLRLRATMQDAAAALRSAHPVLLDLMGGEGRPAGSVAEDIAALDRLAQAATAAIATVPFRDLARPGPGSLADLVWGNPRDRLCRGCARIVIAFRGRSDCTSTPGGLLYRIAAAVWEYATAEDPEGFGLERYVASAVLAERGPGLSLPTSLCGGAPPQQVP